MENQNEEQYLLEDKDLLAEIEKVGYYAHPIAIVLNEDFF